MVGSPSAMGPHRPISLERDSGHVLNIEMLQTAAVPGKDIVWPLCWLYLSTWYDGHHESSVYMLILWFYLDTASTPVSVTRAQLLKEILLVFIVKIKITMGVTTHGQVKLGENNTSSSKSSTYFDWKFFQVWTIFREQFETKVGDVTFSKVLEMLTMLYDI